MKIRRALDGKSVLRLRTGLEMRLSNLWACLFLVFAATTLAVMSINVGFTRTGVSDLGHLAAGERLGGAEVFALLDVRMPRILTGFMAGWCVAMAGAMLQALARNPLADPGLFGLSQGSMVTIMVLLALFPTAPRSIIPLTALAGGLLVALTLIWLVRGDRSGGLAILLMGIAIETVLSSVTGILILYTPAETSYALSDWLAGSLFRADWNGIWAFMPWFALSIPAAFVTGRALRSFGLGDDMAMALGEPVPWSRPTFLFVAVLLSSAAVAAVGPLIFLGVMAPHLAGILSPATGRARLFLSGLTGGTLVIAADILTRLVAADVPLQLGLSLSLIGVPLFIIALRLRALRTISNL
ncbi:MAG: iron ABC transporter permease [Pseudomonadota bacterium]